ncbi:hypothetical protein GCM10023158_11250 [Gluconacetobacter tumulicola]
MFPVRSALEIFPVIPGISNPDIRHRRGTPIDPGDKKHCYSNNEYVTLSVQSVAFLRQGGRVK